MENNITHDWMVSNGFHHHTSTKINLYSRDGYTYVHDEGEDFGVRVQNFIRQKPVKLISDMVEFHRIISGVTIKIN
jgi:hypothetical protein